MNAKNIKKKYLILILILIITIITILTIKKYINAHEISLSPAIGVQTIELYDNTRPGHHAPGAQRQITIELWYPALNDQPLNNQEARNASFYNLHTQIPLIMLSHGSDSNRHQYTWLTHHLARNGFAVAAVDHYGNSWPTIMPQYYLQPWDRALDITYALNYLMTGNLAHYFNPECIGAIGYSFGGQTTMLLAGAQMISYENQEPINVNNIIDAQLPEQLIKEVISHIDTNKITQSYYEKRIKAACLLAPLYKAFNDESIKNISIPVLIIDAEKDQECPSKKHGERYAQELLPHYLYNYTVIPQADHHIFKNITYQKNPLNNINQIHNTIAQKILDFFKTTLKN
jgi:predicted dienelactone hydrolase